MSASEIWTANKYIREPVGNGGNPRIPTLKTKNAAGWDILVSDNEEKANPLAKTFFPPPPVLDHDFDHYVYPEPLPDPPQLTTEQLLKHIGKPGPNNIPNAVLQQCETLIQGWLLRIYQAILNLGIYYDPWKDFTTVVLRKPGKPSYEVPKAYRPIALLSCIENITPSSKFKNQLSSIFLEKPSQTQRLITADYRWRDQN